MKRSPRNRNSGRSGSFAEYVEATRVEAGRRIWVRARTASHLAKMSRGQTRREFYALKRAAIRRATDLCPEAVRVSEVRPLDSDTVLVGVRFRGAGGLHFLTRADVLTPLGTWWSAA